tara:strand:- start:332 stop:559 length:228 start_codon:yes stop_codon:yes gene_type:complete
VRVETGDLVIINPTSVIKHIFNGADLMKSPMIVTNIHAGKTIFRTLIECMRGEQRYTFYEEDLIVISKKQSKQSM